MWQRTVLAGGEYIYVPGTSTYSQGFAALEGCVWSAPVKLHSVYILQTCYVEAFCLAADQLLPLQAFFVHTLGIRASCGWKDIVHEIRSRKEGITINHEEVTDLYKCLEDICPTENDARELKYFFATSHTNT